MDRFEIRGGQKLFGELEIDSAKNALMPIIAATILTEGEVVLKNAPRIKDVYRMLDIIEAMGGKTSFVDKTITVNNQGLNKFELPTLLAKELRSSIFMLGPLLSKYKYARVPFPGGCDIGSRPIDLHLAGFRDLNVVIEEEYGYINCDASNMRSGFIHLDFPSVGATENLMMAAVLIEGETTIQNVAKEPEIVDLQNFLNSLGGKIEGAGTSTIKVTGVKQLSGGTYRSIPDRIITGTFMIAAAMTKGKVELSNTNFEHVFSLINKLRNSGCNVDFKNDKIIVECNKRLASCSFETQPYPGFPTDLQAQMLALQTVSDGTSLIVENLFETRYKHVPELLKMGAKIVTRDRMAIVKGVNRLFGAEVMAHDLRGGAALILAGLVAKGDTVVQNINYVDRGYDSFDLSLKSLGADITRKQ